MPVPYSFLYKKITLVGVIGWVLPFRAQQIKVKYYQNGSPLSSEIGTVIQGYISVDVMKPLKA